MPSCCHIEPAINDILQQNPSYKTTSRSIKQHGSALNMKSICLVLAAGLVSALGVSVAGAESQSGIASVYSTESGSRTATGAKLDPGALTAAHRSLPFGTRVRVTNRSNGKTVVVTINDRGPFVRGRIIDLTPAAAHALGFCCVAPVTVDKE
jgi:rare lipoprotein A